MKASRQATDLLTHWGRWSREGRGIPRCASAMEVVMRGNVPESGGDPINIDDDNALMVDTIVARLMRRDREMGRVLSMYYQSDDQSIRAICRVMDMPQSRVARVLSAGEAWVDGVLDEKLYEAA